MAPCESCTVHGPGHHRLVASAQLHRCHDAFNSSHVARKLQLCSGTQPCPWTWNPPTSSPQEWTEREEGPGRGHKRHHRTRNLPVIFSRTNDPASAMIKGTKNESEVALHYNDIKKFIDKKGKKGASRKRSTRMRYKKQQQRCLRIPRRVLEEPLHATGSTANQSLVPPK